MSFINLYMQVTQHDAGNASYIMCDITAETCRFRYFLAKFRTKHMFLYKKPPLNTMVPSDFK